MIIFMVNFFKKTFYAFETKIINQEMKQDIITFYFKIFKTETCCCKNQQLY